MVGDLVSVSVGYNNGRSINIYGKILDLIDEYKNSYNKYNIIRGQGDKNSKVFVVINLLAYCKDLSKCDLANITLNPHDVYLLDIDNEIDDINRKIDFLKSKSDFIRINENRADKLDKILNEEEIKD